MKLTSLSLAVAAACALSQSAQAHGYHHHRYGYREHASRLVLSQRYLERSRYASDGAAAGRSWGRNWDQGWQQWPSDASAGRRRDGRGEGREYSSERRRSFRHAHFARHGERGEDRGYSRYAERADFRGGYGARPAAWCGWEMRHLVGGDPGRRYNLARNWAHWGHSGPAGVGAVVVWPHHVGKIVGRDGNQWVIESGNDGHRLRTRPRSIGGAIAVRWG